MTREEGIKNELLRDKEIGEGHRFGEVLGKIHDSDFVYFVEPGGHMEKTVGFTSWLLRRERSRGWKLVKCLYADCNRHHHT